MTLLPQSIGYAYSAETNRTIVDQVHYALSQLEEPGTYETLQIQFIKPNIYCPKRDGDISQLQIGLSHIAGLWIMLGSTILAAVLLNIILFYYSRYKKRKQLLALQQEIEPT